MAYLIKHRGGRPEKARDSKTGEQKLIKAEYDDVFEGLPKWLSLDDPKYSVSDLGVAAPAEPSAPAPKASKKKAASKSTKKKASKKA